MLSLLSNEGHIDLIMLVIAIVTSFLVMYYSFYVDFYHISILYDYFNY